jgi:hypothetical protein
MTEIVIQSITGTAACAITIASESDRPGLAETIPGNPLGILRRDLLRPAKRSNEPPEILGVPVAHLGSGRELDGFDFQLPTYQPVHYQILHDSRTARTKARPEF